MKKVWWSPKFDCCDAEFWADATCGNPSHWVTEDPANWTKNPTAGGPTKLDLKAAEVAALVKEKQEAYGDSFNFSGDILQILYPDGVKPEQYRDMLAIVRVIDKLFRIANKKDAFGEDPWKDINGYSLLAMGDK